MVNVELFRVDYSGHNKKSICTIFFVHEIKQGDALVGEYSYRWESFLSAELYICIYREREWSCGKYWPIRLLSTTKVRSDCLGATCDSRTPMTLVFLLSCWYNNLVITRGKLRFHIWCWIRISYLLLSQRIFSYMIVLYFFMFFVLI